MFNFTHFNFPRVIEDNPLFRSLFMFRKLFLTQRSFQHYAGAAEDIHLQKLFPKNFKGVFVDVGCYHPTKYSNTFLLYKKGWRGINVDIDSIKIDMFRLRRPRDTNIQCAVSDKNGWATYYKHGFFSQINSLSHSTDTSNCREEIIECKTLTSIIDSTKYRDRHIDLLSVDAEGHDFEVIKSLDFSRYKPSVIIVEINDRLFERITRSDLYRYLLQQKYSLVGWCGVSLFMASEDYLKQHNT